ncbi:MAG: hypothetical protein GY851_11775, partial [bacterium]|nr:hypothetical protein [bacterium]
YRRTIALTEAGYLVDVFRVRGGQQHDYGFGSIGTELSPFGVTSIEKRPGSLAEGRDWGQQIGNDADIKGYPQKPYWNPPPGNGYGFFFNVKAGEPEPVWGGEWAIAGTVPTRFRMHVASSVDEAIFVTAPGLYPTYPLSSYVIARRESEGDAPLASTFLAVYEPYVVNAFQYAFDCNALLARICDNTAEVKPLTTLGSMVLKGTKAGDSMSFRLTLSEGQSNPLVLHCVTAPSYGTMQVEWDGKPVGEPLSLFSDGVQAPRPFVIGEVNTTAGDHTLTIRVEDGAAFFLGLAAVSFGEATEEDAACTRRLAEMKRLDDAAVEVVRVDGAIDLILSGPCDAVSRYGHVEFEGDFAYLTGDGSRLKAVETLGCAKLACGGKVVDEGPAAFEAHVVEVDLATRSVLLDRAPPNGLARLMAVFSNPAYSRTTGYHVLRVEGRRVFLQASTFVLGVGQVKEIIGPTELNSAIPHEYARAVKGAGSSRFFDGKRLVAESGAETRVTGTVPGGILRVEVEDTSVLRIGDRFEYIDLSVGDTVRVALPRVVAEAQLN